MNRPTRFEDFRYLGDKRKQVVYDLDTDDADAVEAHRRAHGLGAVRRVLARHAGRGPQPGLPPGTASARPPTPTDEPCAGSVSAGRLSTAPLRRASNATSDSAGSLGSDAGSSGRPSRSTHDVQPPYSSSHGTVTGSASRCTRSASTHSGSRFFQPRRDAA